MTEPEKQRLKNLILSYLVRHPKAQDTVDGIVQWWVLEQQIFTATKDVEEVLTALVGDGYITKVKGYDSRDCYKVNEARLQDISRLLRSGRG